MAKTEIFDTSHNLIAKDTIVKGEIITKGDFRIDKDNGHAKGNGTDNPKNLIKTCHLTKEISSAFTTKTVLRVKK